MRPPAWPRPRGRATRATRARRCQRMPDPCRWVIASGGSSPCSCRTHASVRRRRARRRRRSHAGRRSPRPAPWRPDYDTVTDRVRHLLRVSEHRLVHHQRADGPPPRRAVVSVLPKNAAARARPKGSNDPTHAGRVAVLAHLDSPRPAVTLATARWRSQDRGAMRSTDVTSDTGTGRPRQDPRVRSPETLTFLWLAASAMGVASGGAMWLAGIERGADLAWGLTTAIAAVPLLIGVVTGLIKRRAGRRRHRGARDGGLARARGVSRRSHHRAHVRGRAGAREFRQPPGAPRPVRAAGARASRRHSLRGWPAGLPARRRRTARATGCSSRRARWCPSTASSQEPRPSSTTPR